MTNFKKIQSEITSFHNDIEDKKQLETKLLKQRIESDISILEQAGVVKLFEEIRDNGVVIERKKNAYELKNRKRFFGRREDKLDYIPAKIRQFGRLFDGYRFSLMDNRFVAISLEFNMPNNGSYDLVLIVVVEGELYLATKKDGSLQNLFSPNYRYVDFNYSLIKNGELEDTIIEGIKHPIKVIKLGD